LSVLAVVVLRRVGLPPILGYLAVGILAGPYMLGWISESEVIHLLAEIGVVFLLFAIGLEFSIAKFMSMRYAVLGLGGAQVAVSTAAGGLIVWFYGLGWQAALVAGSAMALSSTAMVVKQLSEQLELQSRHGNLAIGVLLFQDLAVVPLLVIIPILAEGSTDGLWMPLGLALIKGLVAFLVMLAMGRWVLRPLFHGVASAHSAELFTLTVLLVALAAAWVTSQLGLSLALGAFLAGMMLSETEYRHQIEADVRPFRDMLMGLFFIAIGLQFNIAVLPQIWHKVAVLVTGIVIGKGLVVALLTRLAGYENGVALRTGIVLAQGGEFGFALLALALNRGLIDPMDSQAVIASILISMLLAPILIRYNGVVAKRLFSGTYLKGRYAQAREIGAATRELRDHVVICGFGRIGQNLARFLREEDIEYIALDLNPKLIREAWEAGERVFYGDATHTEILRAAGVHRARMLVIATDDAHAAEKIIHSVRRRSSEIPILVRSRDDSHLEHLMAAGATVVVPETLEASMMLAQHLLTHLGVPLDEVMFLVEKARHGHYQALRGFFHPTEADVEREDKTFLHTVVLPADADAVNKRLGEFQLAELDVRVNALRRGAIRGDSPNGEVQLQEGDALVLQGTREAIELAERRLLQGMSA
jgi:CPA2 family monovalent cation:H+ antiporter-2